jgi:hypothetical protein
MATKKSTVAKAKSKAMSDREDGAIVQKLQRASIIASGQKSVRLGSSRDPRGPNRLVSGPDGTGRMGWLGQKFVTRPGIDEKVTLGKRAKKKRAGAGSKGRSGG